MDYIKDKEEFEKAFILKALELFNGINDACRSAKIPKKTLLRKCAKYGINTKDFWASSHVPCDRTDEPRK